MSEESSTSEKININQDLLAILCCPETKQDVSLIDQNVLKRLNQRIEEGELKNKAGQLVTEKIDGGLLRADRKFVYPIKDGIPILLVEEGIPVHDLF